MSHEINDGAGKLRVGDAISADMHPYTGPDGSTTTLQNSIFSTVPGSPAYVGVADHQKIDLPKYGMTWEREKKNAIQADWKMRARRVSAGARQRRAGVAGAASRSRVPLGHSRVAWAARDRGQSGGAGGLARTTTRLIHSEPPLRAGAGRCSCSRGRR